jgi:hypothetical protein
MYRLWWDIAHNTSKVFKHSATQLMELYSNMNAYFKEWYNDDALANWSLVDPNFLKDYVIDGWYIPATAEAARRYYSAKQIETFGAPDVASGIRPWSVLGKFFDLTDPDRLENSLPRADNKHYVVFSLKKTLERFADFPIEQKKVSRDFF